LPIPSAPKNIRVDIALEATSTPNIKNNYEYTT